MSLGTFLIIVYGLSVAVCFGFLWERRSRSDWCDWLSCFVPIVNTVCAIAVLSVGDRWDD